MSPSGTFCSTVRPHHAVCSLWQIIDHAAWESGAGTTDAMQIKGRVGSHFAVVRDVVYEDIVFRNLTMYGSLL